MNEKEIKVFHASLLLRVNDAITSNAKDSIIDEIKNDFLSSWDESFSFYVDPKELMKRVIVLNNADLVRAFHSKSIFLNTDEYKALIGYHLPLSPTVLFEIFTNDSPRPIHKKILTKAFYQCLSKSILNLEPYCDVLQMLEWDSPSAGNLGKEGMRDLVRSAFKFPKVGTFFSFSSQEKKDFFSGLFDEAFRVKSKFHKHPDLIGQYANTLYRTNTDIVTPNEIKKLVEFHTSSKEERLELYRLSPYSELGMSLLLKDVEVFESILPDVRVASLNQFEKELLVQSTPTVEKDYLVERGLITAIFKRIYPINLPDDDHKIKRMDGMTQKALSILNNNDPSFHGFLYVIGQSENRAEQVVNCVTRETRYVSHSFNISSFLRSLYLESKLYSAIKTNVESTPLPPSRPARF